MRVKFLSAAVLALGLMGLAPIATAQEGGFGSPSLLPVSRNPRLSSTQSDRDDYRSVSWQDKNQDLPPPAPASDYPAPTPADPAIGAGVSGNCAGGNNGILGGYSSGASAWSDGSCGGAGGYGDAYATSGDYSSCAGFWGGSGPGGCAYGRGPRCGYFGSIGGMVMTKGRDDFNQLSFNDLDPAGAVLTTQNSRMETFGGGTFEFGKWIDGTGWGIGATYWGVWGPTQTTTVNSASLGGGNLNTVFDFGALNIGATGVNSLYDAATVHQLSRSYAVNNLEINMFQSGCYTSSGKLGVGMMFGPRWFRYREGFNYQSSDADALLNTGLDDVAYQTTTNNDLIGFQAGARINYQPHARTRFFAAPKFGLYNNHISLDSSIGGPGGLAVVGPGNVFAGQAYDIHTSANQVAFLGEIGVGADIYITQCWALTVGYRAVTACGVAQPFNQIPQNFAGLNDAADINRSGCVLIHGAYAGLNYNF